MKIVRIFLILLLVLSPYLYCKFFGECCWVDYTSDIQKLAKPIQNEFYEFILKHNRAPTLAEEEELITGLGCKDIDTYYRGGESTALLMEGDFI